MAKYFLSLFVAKPIPGASHDTLEQLPPCAGDEVLRPHLSGMARDFHNDHIPALQAMLANHFEAMRKADLIEACTRGSLCATRDMADQTLPPLLHPPQHAAQSS